MTFVDSLLSMAQTNQAKLVALAVAGIVGYSFTFRKSSGKVCEFVLQLQQKFSIEVV